MERILYNSRCGEYSWLSCFHLCQVTVPVERFGKTVELTFKSAEHAYQYEKTSCPVHQMKIFNAATAAEAKYLGSVKGGCKIRPDWDENKMPWMEIVLTAKYSQNTYLREKLLATLDAELIEHSSWGKFWGWCEAKGGNNVHGNIQMDVRDNLNQ